MHLHYLHEGNACVTWVGYDIVNVCIGYYPDKVNKIVTIWRKSVIKQ
jgi:hypothetical protein